MLPLTYRYARVVPVRCLNAWRARRTLWHYAALLLNKNVGIGHGWRTDGIAHIPYYLYLTTIC